MSSERFEVPGAPLCHPIAMDKALRELMPIVEQLTNADAALANGDGAAGAHFLLDALALFRTLPARSVAVTCYLNWLQQNTAAEHARVGHDER